jgi:3-(3-hydroxy-phenyl)propionate hydroxylase
MTDEIFDVVVIGYGPTGLVLASSLGQKGHRVALVERWPALYGLPRLSHIDDETARIVQATADIDLALRDAVPIDTYRFVNAAGELLTAVGGARQGPCGYPADISIYQPDIEEAIDLRVQQCPSVERLLGWEAIALTQDAKVVSVTARSTAGGQERELRARYLVGCDGARSFVRETLGVACSDLGFNERWLNIDVEKLRDVPARFAEAVQYCDPARGHMHLSIGSKRLRFELALLDGEDADVFTAPEFAWKWLSEQHQLGPEDVRIIRQVVYTFSAKMAHVWRSGRVLLAGDACHTMPPYLGQGACSGMRDGFNLGWRLDLILRGVASDALLDTYEQERRPHVDVITKMAIGLGKLANEHDPERARQRDEALRSRPPQKLDFPILHNGLLDPTRSSLTGTIWLQGNVEYDGRYGYFDDVIGRGFILLSRLDVTSHVPPEILRAFADMSGRLVALTDFNDHEGKYDRFLSENGLAVVLARPDFVIYGTGQSEADATQLLSNLIRAVTGADINPAIR